MGESTVLNAPPQTLFDETYPARLIEFTLGWIPAKAKLRKEHLRAENRWRPEGRSYTATAWGFCPACRAKPAASRYTRSFFARRARSLFFGNIPTIASRTTHSGLVW